VTVPNEFQPIGTYNIGITAGIETTACSVDFIAGCNRMDMIIVPSEFSKDVLVKTIYSETDRNTQRVIKEHKLEKPVEVLFEGYNEEFFGKKAEVELPELDKIKEDFAFLFVGHWLSGDLGEDRKNVGMMIKTFAIAFKNSKIKPALILKTSTAGFSILDRERLISKIRETLGSDYSKVPVYLLHGDLTQSQMNGLYHHPKVKAMLNFTKGEGFGRPLLEFSLTGKPVIVSNWSGHLDFLKNGAVLLEGDLKEVHPSAANEFLLKESKWFNVNISKSIPIIQDVYTNYANYTKNSLKLGKYNRENFSLEKMTNYFDIILNQYGIYNSKQPTFQQITLPKLKMISK